MSDLPRLNAAHGVLCRMPDEPLGYLAWPSVARLGDGRIVAVCSGLRAGHIGPFGKTVMLTSDDDGASWSALRVIQNSLIDDRDAGVLCLGGQRLVVTWFRSDTRMYEAGRAISDAWRAETAGWTDAAVEPLIGAWLMRSDDGGETWGQPMRTPVTAPHGPCLRANGEMIYLGNRFSTWDELRHSGITACRSVDGGKSWDILADVPLCDGLDGVNTYEAHATELPDGRLLGMIRIQDYQEAKLAPHGLVHFSMASTISDDGGQSWTTARPLGFHGSPPHLLVHSSGRVILTYGYRLELFGQRVVFSDDGGTTWSKTHILRDDGPDHDLGYPATIELDDGSLLSVYYQKAAAEEPCSLLCSRWTMR